MDRGSWRAYPLACAVLLLACGRTPVGVEAGLIVQVVDEGGDGVAAAAVELRPVGDGDGPAIATGRSDRDGVAVLPFPGRGTYELRAQTELRCCLRSGTLETSLMHAGEVVVVETTSGPCPTWTPPSCP